MLITQQLVNMEPLRVLVACEYSGVVRSAFELLGHDATSCDLIPTEQFGRHYTGDVRDILYRHKWDLLIAHPPCTYLSYAAMGHWNQPGRAKKRLEALSFFLTLWEAPIEHICIENPLGIASQVITKHNQIIQPYYFGDNDMKRTCLWLKNLPLLEHHKEDSIFGKKTHVDKPEPVFIDRGGKKRYFTDATSNWNRKAGHKRSKTFPGIAKAMAEQFSNHILKQQAAAV